MANSAIPPVPMIAPSQKEEALTELATVLTYLRRLETEKPTTTLDVAVEEINKKYEACLFRALGLNANSVWYFNKFRVGRDWLNRQLPRGTRATRFEEDISELSTVLEQLLQKITAGPQSRETAKSTSRRSSKESGNSSREMSISHSTFINSQVVLGDSSNAISQHAGDHFNILADQLLEKGLAPFAVDELRTTLKGQYGKQNKKHYIDRVVPWLTELARRSISGESGLDIANNLSGITTAIRTYMGV